MKMSKMMAAIVLATTVTAPAMATAAQTSATSVRVSAPVTKANELAGGLHGSGAIIVGLLAIGVIVGGVIALTNDNNDNPSSR